MSAEEFSEEEALRHYKAAIERSGTNTVKCRACGSLVRNRDLVKVESKAGFGMRRTTRTHVGELPLSAASWPGAIISVCPQCADRWDAVQSVIATELAATVNEAPAKRGRKARCARCRKETDAAHSKILRIADSRVRVCRKCLSAAEKSGAGIVVR